MLSVRCRRCPGCLVARRHLWALRAEIEMLKAPKTVMFTGTFRAQPHLRQVAADELTRWLYRVRKRCGRRDVRVRYLACFERHKSGAWHMHALVHGPNELVTRDLRTPWTAGFSYARVADLGAARYVTKYVTKDLADERDTRLPRIRASRDPRYGVEVMILEEELLALTHKHPELVQETWAQNFKALLSEGSETKSGELWRKISELNLGSTRMLTPDLEVDLLTGEITRLRRE